MKIVIAEKRHENIASLLFQKSGFSKNKLSTLPNQQCNSSRCLTSTTMGLGITERVKGKTVKLDFRHTCASEKIVYPVKCKVCDDPESKSNFYFGQE